ncbi:MAG: biotin/lipoyl-containing protein, partial [Miltoncostaeaceae bacterium]
MSSTSSSVTQVLLPELGESVTEGVVLEWRKSEGDTVEMGETLLEVTTDMVEVEVPAPAAGTITRIVAGEGDAVEVGALL